MLRNYAADNFMSWPRFMRRYIEWPRFKHYIRIVKSSVLAALGDCFRTSWISTVNRQKAVPNSEGKVLTSPQPLLCWQGAVAVTVTTCVYAAGVIVV